MAVMLWTCIQEVYGCNITQTTSYLDSSLCGFHCSNCIHREEHAKTHSSEKRAVGSNNVLQTIFNSRHLCILSHSFLLPTALQPIALLWPPFQQGFENNSVLHCRVFKPIPSPQPGESGL